MRSSSHVSGFDGSVSFYLDTQAGMGSITVELGKWGGAIEERNYPGDVDEDNSVIYSLSQEMQLGEVWTIGHFENGDGEGNVADLDDRSMIDLSPLGIESNSDINIVSVAYSKLYYDSDAGLNWGVGNVVYEGATKFVLGAELLDGNGNAVEALSTPFKDGILGYAKVVGEYDFNDDGETDVTYMIISESDIQLDLNHDGIFDQTKGLVVGVENTDLNSDGIKDKVVFLDFAPSYVDENGEVAPLTYTDENGNEMFLSDLMLLDQSLLGDQALFLIVPSSSEHTFNILVGVTDAQVELNDTFFVGVD